MPRDVRARVKLRLYNNLVENTCMHRHIAAVR